MDWGSEVLFQVLVFPSFRHPPVGFLRPWLGDDGRSFLIPQEEHPLLLYIQLKSTRGIFTPPLVVPAAPPSIGIIRMSKKNIKTTKKSRKSWLYKLSQKVSYTEEPSLSTGDLALDLSVTLLILTTYTGLLFLINILSVGN